MEFMEDPDGDTSPLQTIKDRYAAKLVALLNNVEERSWLDKIKYPAEFKTLGEKYWLIHESACSKLKHHALAMAQLNVDPILQQFKEDTAGDPKRIEDFVETTFAEIETKAAEMFATGRKETHRGVYVDAKDNAIYLLERLRSGHDKFDSWLGKQIHAEVRTAVAQADAAYKGRE